MSSRSRAGSASGAWSKEASGSRTTGSGAFGAGLVRTEQHRAPGMDARWHGDETEEGTRGHALSTPGLAHQAEGLAVTDVDVDAVDGVDATRLRLEVDLETDHRGHRPGRVGSSGRLGSTGQGHRFDSVLGSRMSRSPSPTRLKASAHRKTIRPGNVEAHQRPAEMPA